MTPKQFTKLETIARSLKPCAQTGKSFHVTAVFNKRKLVCLAHNDYTKIHRSHRYGPYIGRTGQDTYVAGMHSECAALIKMGEQDCSHLTFVNIRIDNLGKPALSKPCKNCQRVLKSVGYKNIWYYDGKKYTKQHNE